MPPNKDYVYILDRLSAEGKDELIVLAYKLVGQVIFEAQKDPQSQIESVVLARGWYRRFAELAFGEKV